MIEKFKSKRTSKYLLLMVIFLLVVNISLGYLLVKKAKDTITTLIHTRMLDIVHGKMNLPSCGKEFFFRPVSRFFFAQ